MNETDSEGFTLLHDAARAASLPMVELLVERGADVNVEGMECIRPMNHAQWRQDREGRRIAEFLGEQGATPGECGDPG